MKIQNANSDTSLSPEYLLHVSENELKVLGAILGTLCMDKVKEMIGSSFSFSDACDEPDVTYGMYSAIVDTFGR